jgi:flagellar motor protein MotB
MTRRTPEILLLCFALVATGAQAQLQREPPRGQAVERHLPGDQTFMQWTHDEDALGTQAGDRIAVREVAAEALETVRLTNLVPPIRFESGVAEIPDSTVVELREILDGMRDRRNVRLHLIGHADTQPLSPALAAIFGDNEGLSRERAGEVAEFLQRTLALPPDAVSYEWAGDTQPVASNETAEGRALNRRVAVEVWYDVATEAVALEEFVIREDFTRIKVCRIETVCRLRFIEGNERRTRVQHLVAPLNFGEDAVEITPAFTDQIRQAFANLRDRHNVQVRFIGYTDDLPLSDRNERIYGTHVGLARARARRVALEVQEALGLPTAAVDSDGRGSVRPLGSNQTAQGRALNRRVEVEFWYDDPLQELPDEPQICPAPGNEIVTRVYDPPWGSLPALALDNGQPVVPAGYAGLLQRALTDVAGRMHPRLRFVGYTANQRLERRTAVVYGDDIGLSAARARRAMEVIGAELGLAAEQLEFEGRGYVHSDDVVNVGFVQGETSHVVVQVVYDEVAALDDYDGVDVTPITRELLPGNAFGLNLMRITIDGLPIDDPGRSSADVQRCTDVALQDAQIQFSFDNLEASRRLAVAAEPATVTVHRTADGDVASPVRFSMYANYAHFIERAEVRVFDQAQSVEAEPLAVVTVNGDGSAEWQPEVASFSGPVRELKYVLRAWGRGGSFDETVPQPLWVVYAEDARASSRQLEPDRSQLLAYGESALGRSGIPMASGTVTVRGSAIPPGHAVWVAGRPVPVDPEGRFVAQEILPAGVHTVEVAVLDPQGNGELFLRDLELQRNDWFYVGMADLTLSRNSSRGPIELLQGENSRYDHDSSADARLAFFTSGKFGDNWRLAASADTRDEPLSSLFSNFMSKSPDSLFRRIDPDYHYPTFGDDGIVEEMTPTLGKFYVRVEHRDTYAAQWGNFRIGYMNNELAQVDRGLYGANVRYQSDVTTSFGERRYAIDGFTAEPGTIGAREEFRGTGGSLYFLRRQDVLTGSERVRIELRDRASGLVTGVLNLTPGIDYDMDYLQGRILLAEPLASTGEDDLLVRSGALRGDEAWLVVRYEHSPGFEEIDALAVGGQAHYWFADRVKLGLTANANDVGLDSSSLHAADVTVRFSADSWFKLQGAQTEGMLMSTMHSADGGFGFAGFDELSFASASAGGHRADVSVGLSDFLPRDRGRVTLYRQSLDAGYSAPGLATLTDTVHYGGTFSMPLTENLSLRAKSDTRDQDQGLLTSATEINVSYRLSDNWGVSTGVRQDERIDRSPIVPLTQEQGERTDAVVQIEYDSLARWRAYGFVQDTVSVDGDRTVNSRFGTGGSYRLSERLRIDAEVSDGDLGAGGKLGTSYMHSDRTTLYVNYALENERTDNGLRSARGTEGNVIAGVKSRLSDSTSVYLEERYRYGDLSAGLTHATGISLAPTERLNFGASTDIGTLRDMQTGAETKRRAAGLRMGYGFDALQVSSGIEYRDDATEAPDLTFSTRSTWLFRNSFRYQITPDARLLGKLNHSESESSLGQFYDGGFTEAVLGFAYRPVYHDRLNALVKYTYFYNVPTTDQITLRNTAAEFIQKSHVAALDLNYDLTRRWSVGGKYAHRRGQMSLERENPVFFDNTARLFVLRADFRFMGQWEGMIEGRVLDMPDLRDRRSGHLLVVSRYLNRHLKIGVGYNFTDFSDDLTDLSFDHRGTFLSVTGVM